jgi:hypothetical protein
LRATEVATVRASIIPHVPPDRMTTTENRDAGASSGGRRLSDGGTLSAAISSAKSKFSGRISLEITCDLGIIRTVGITRTADARRTPDLQWIVPPRRLLWGIVTDRG